MTLKLYTEVALTADLPSYGLKSGDIATLIDVVPHPDNGEDGYILEVFNAVSESVDVITVQKSKLIAI